MKLGRKISGGRYIASRKKKLYEHPGKKRIVRLGEEIRKTKTSRGGNTKSFLFKAKFINLTSKGKIKRVEIKNVVETPSDKFLARQNIMTKGTIVDTELGKARITNRPGQEGSINGVLLG